MLSIRTNLSSFIAQNSMRTSTDKLNQAIERMTTGSKINHAKDNAANYSISTNMQTRMGALRVAEDNALQGLEMMSSTSENLSLIEEKLVRMRALAVQAQSGTYGTKSLNALSAEADSLLNEINRINESATYNGIKLFNTGKDNSVTNAGKELELNAQGFLQDIVRRDTSAMVTVESLDENVAITSGTYSITTVEELEKLARMTNNGLIRGGEFVLGADLDLKAAGYGQATGKSWQPIGAYYYSGGWKGGDFKANFDGNGHTISNLYMNYTGGNENSKVGLFGTSYGTIKNLKLTNINIRGGSYSGNCIGAVVGYNAGKVENCSVTGVVKGGQDVITGGVVGGNSNPTYHGSSVSNCYFKGEVSATGVKGVGGIAGAENQIKNCLFSGNVRGDNNVGGVAGSATLVESSNASGRISGNTSVGGISASGTAKNSFFAGSVSGQDKVGGISGKSSSTNCIFEGSVSGTTNVGIFSGGTSVTIQDGYYYGTSLSKLSATADDTASTVSNITDITIPTDYTLQIASSGDEATSTISCTTYIDFGGLKDLLSSGLESSSSIEKIDNLISIASLKQAELGMMEQRLYSVLDEISTQYENLVSSHSTIKDADMAKVSSQYIQQQILQDASATLLASTQNIQAQNVLGLIQSLSNLS